jgi:hypothetical protein
MTRWEQLPLVVGEFYEGAYGPTVLLDTQSIEGVALFQSILAQLASSSPGTTIRLGDDPRISLSAALWSLDLRVAGESAYKHLSRANEGVGFIWVATHEEWETMSLLMESLLERIGHQYLTNESVDDALIEFSRGENHGLWP